MSHDSVMATNDDASACKRCAVDTGYWDDPFISCFTPKSRRRPPEINLGYFARVRGIQQLISCFIRQQPDGSAARVQLVSLGAGFDTLYWRMRRDCVQFAAFVEIDLPPVVSRKIRAIRQHHTLSAVLQSDGEEMVINDGNLHAGEYHLICGDISKPEVLLQTLFSYCHLAVDLPTIFVSECVLVYLPSEKSSQLLQQLTHKFSSALFINYEMVVLGDRFGEVLLENMRARGCELAGASACLSEQTQIDRFLSAGCSEARLWSMNSVLERLPREDVERVRKLEMFDDVSVLHQLLDHYGICVAWKSSATSSSSLRLDLMDFS